MLVVNTYTYKPAVWQCGSVAVLSVKVKGAAMERLAQRLSTPHSLPWGPSDISWLSGSVAQWLSASKWMDGTRVPFSSSNQLIVQTRRAVFGEYLLICWVSVIF